MKKAIELPPGEDLNEWLAMLTVEHFNSANLCWGFVEQTCNVESCPKMTAGRNYTYLWQDSKNEKYSKSTELPAFEYTGQLLIWVSDLMDDEAVFPTTEAGKFPKNFLKMVKKIWTRLFRIYFHIYYHHWAHVQKVEAEPHINTSFKWLYYASSVFQIVDPNDLEPMKEVIKKIPDMETVSQASSISEDRNRDRDTMESRESIDTHSSMSINESRD